MSGQVQSGYYEKHFCQGTNDFSSDWIFTFGKSPPSYFQLSSCWANAVLAVASYIIDKNESVITIFI